MWAQTQHPRHEQPTRYEAHYTYVSSSAVGPSGRHAMVVVGRSLMTVSQGEGHAVRAHIFTHCLRLMICPTPRQQQGQPRQRGQDHRQMRATEHARHQDTQTSGPRRGEPSWGLFWPCCPVVRLHWPRVQIPSWLFTIPALLDQQHSCRNVGCAPRTVQQSLLRGQVAALFVDVLRSTRFVVEGA